MIARTTGAYGRVRKQFKLPIGKFEGVEEALARIGGQHLHDGCCAQIDCASRG